LRAVSCKPVSLFAFYATFDESLGVVRDLCAHGLSIIPHTGALDAPAAPTFESVDDNLVSHFRNIDAVLYCRPVHASPDPLQAVEDWAER
jgi:hypothetical protein